MYPDLELRRLLAALAAGIIALIPNELILQAADVIGLATAHGGLLALVRILATKIFDAIKLGGFWSGSIQPGTTSPGFQVGFHVVVAIGMAVFHAIFLEPRLRMHTLAKGLLYGTVVWLLNAFLVLPATQQGLIGLEHINAAGAIWFAAAHFAFFVTLAWAFDKILKRLPFRS